MRIRYVNTASTAGGDGTTNATVGTTRAYATLAEGLTPFHGTSITDAYTFLASGGSDAGNLDHTAWEFVTSPANYVTVIGDNVSGRWNPAAYHLIATDHSVLYNQYAAHVRLYNLQAQLKVTSGGAFNVFRLSTANNDTTNGPGYLVVANCVARRDPTSTAGDIGCYIDSILGSGSGVSYRYNNLAIGGAFGTGNTTGFNTDAGAWALANAHSYNMTAAQCQYGFLDNAETINCLATACGFGFIGTFSGATDYNANDDGNGVAGLHSRNGTTFVFVDSANGDYRLASIDTGARNFGLTNPASGLFSDDSQGESRSSPWDIGADEYVVAASTNLSVAMIDEAWIGGSLI